MSNTGEMPRYREVARYVVELRWHAPRTWGGRRLPHGGRFYAHAEFASPRRCIWTHAEATGAIGPGGIETTELAILTAADDPNVPDIRPGESFGLMRIGVAADGRGLRRLK